MRIAIFSDVHGNLTALEAVLDHLAHQPDVDKIVFAGDICLFGPRPSECLNLIHQSEIEFLVGNTDEWLRNPPPIHHDMDDSQRKNRQNIQDWCSWTIDHFSESNQIHLDELRSIFMRRYSPTENPDEDLLIVHANPIDLMEVIYPTIDTQLNIFGEIRQSDEDLEPLLDGVEAAALAYGHLHIPSIRNWRNLLLWSFRLFKFVKLPISGGSWVITFSSSLRLRRLVNFPISGGSVEMPRSLRSSTAQCSFASCSIVSRNSSSVIA